MSEFVRPPFVAESRWNRARDAEKQFWHQFGADLLEGMKQPWFRRLVHVVMDHPEWCGQSAVTFDEANARLQDWNEGRRSIAVQLSKALQGIAPDLCVRMLTESMNRNRELEIAERAQEAREAEE